MTSERAEGSEHCSAYPRICFSSPTQMNYCGHLMEKDHPLTSVPFKSQTSVNISVQRQNPETASIPTPDSTLVHLGSFLHCQDNATEEVNEDDVGGSDVAGVLNLQC